MSSRHDRSSKYDRERTDRDRERRRRRRSPSYSSESSESDSESDSEYSRSPPPRRSTTRKTRTAYSDGEDKNSGRGRDRERRGRYYEEDSESPERRGVVQDLLAAIGLVKEKARSSMGGGRDSKSDRSVAKRGDRDGLSSEDKKKAQIQAIQAALTAAAVEAFKTRKEGGLTPQRLMQIAAAAIAAGGLDALVDRNPNSGSMRHVIESVVAGLAAGKTVGGQVKHKRPDSHRGKVAGGMIGMATKQILSRSMSRGAGKRRSKD